MLHVITGGEFGSRFTPDRGQGIVVLRSDLPFKNGSFHEAIDELSGTEAKNRALGFAVTQGVGDARINGISSAPYPVNDDGVPLEHVRDQHGQPLPLTHPKMQVKGYHVAIPVTRRLV